MGARYKVRIYHLIPLSLLLSFQNCSKVGFNTDLAKLSSSGAVVTVNDGKPSNKPVQTVSFSVDTFLKDTGATITEMRLGLDRGELNHAPFIPFSNPTQIDLGKEYAPDGSKDGTKTVYVDLKVAGVATPMSLIGSLALDTIAPVATSTNVNHGVSPTILNYTQVQIDAIDSASRITQICLKTRAEQPEISDVCWMPVNQLGGKPSRKLKLDAAPFLLGFLQGKYTVYVFAQDEAGNVSRLSSAGQGTDQVDRKSIVYNPPVPPVLINVVASNTDSAALPPTLDQLKTSAGDTLYIKWKVASAPGGLGPKPIRLYYTTDEAKFTLISDKVANEANAGCTTDVNFSGCFAWKTATETNSYFRIRVGVLDKNGQLTYSSSMPVNSGKFYVLGGNTDPGLGGTASAAIFYNEHLTDPFLGDPQSFVVTQFGSIVFRDSQRGLILVDPRNGIQDLIVPLDPSGNATDGPLGQATLGWRLANIALDYQDRILIGDKNSVRILDLQARKVSTLFGTAGGSLDDGTLASAFNAQKTSSLYPLPNGDLVFKTEKDYATSVAAGAGIRYFSAAEGKVFRWAPSGSGGNWNGSWYGDWNVAAENHWLLNFHISFDPMTSKVTNLFAEAAQQIVGDWAYYYFTLNPKTFAVLPQADHLPVPFPFGHGTDYYVADRVGNMTAFSRWSGKIKQFDPASSVWKDVAGTGTVGQCHDGTDALACNLDLQSVFIGPQNQIYFADRGRIRTLSDGKVITLAGQSFSFGDEGQAISARFGLVHYIDRDKDGNVVVLDSTENRFRQFTPGAVIRTIAGNGTAAAPEMDQAAVGQPILTGYWGGLYSFAMDHTTSDLYFGPYKLSTTSGKWETLFDLKSSISPSSSANFAAADGRPANEIGGGYPWMTLGFGGGKLLQANNNWTYDSEHPGGWVLDSFYKLYDSTNHYTQSNLAGSHRPSANSFGTPGDLLTDTQVPYTFNESNSRAFYDQDLDQWYALQNGAMTIYTLKEGADQKLRILTALPRAAKSFTYALNSAKEPLVYYCAFSEGRIYKLNLVTHEESAISWPSSTITCQGLAIYRSSERQSVVFPFQQNGLFGVGEIVDPL